MLPFYQYNLNQQVVEAPLRNMEQNSELKAYDRPEILEEDKHIIAYKIKELKLSKEWLLTKNN